MKSQRILLLVFVFAFAGTARATNVTIATGGRVTIELIGAEAAFRNTMSVASPAVGIAITGCRLEPADGLGGTRVVSERLSQRGCRVDLDADPATAGIQGFAAGTTFELQMCAQTDADAQCEYTWSSDPAHNSDGFDHLHVTEIVPGQVFQLNWEDFPGGGDNDFNDLIAVLRVNQDTDGDGLWDDWETTGIDTNGDGVIDLDLPALGANPNHKDIFVEVDWMDCAHAGSDCAAGDTHTHRPLAAAITAVTNAFANSPVPNPDGVNGINMHLVLSNSIAHQNILNINGLCFDGGAGIGSFDAVKADPANFGPDNPRRFAFHYVLFTHSELAGNTTSGCAELPGNDFQVSLGGWDLACNGGTRNARGCLTNADCPGAGASCTTGWDFDGDGISDSDIGTAAQQAGTLMHELGHNLNLQHGGGDSINNKPNYLSVMNYSFQTTGIPPTNRLDYSRNLLATLTETNLSEAAGIGAGADRTVFVCANLNFMTSTAAAIDWNCDGDTVDAAVNADINGDGFCTGPGHNGTRETAASGDDRVVGLFVLTGPDHQCSTAAIGDDDQFIAVGSSEAAPLVGFADWPNLLYEFQSTGSFDDGAHPVPPERLREITYPQWSQNFAPDIALKMSAAPPVVVTGSNVTYSIVVQNTHPTEAHDVTVTDVLPATETFVACSATGGGACGGSGNNRTVTFASVPGGTSYVVTLVASVSCSLADGVTIANSASVAAPQDADASNDSASVSITTSDPPPVISNVSVSKPQLSPPNHKMVDVTVSYTLTDNCPLSEIARSLSVSSSESIDGSGDGTSSPDWEVVDANTVRLRAERSGNGPGRIYTIKITAKDAGGSSSTATTTVTVPH